MDMCIPETCEDDAAPACEGLNARRHADTVTDCNNLTALNQNSCVQMRGSIWRGIYRGVRDRDILRQGHSN